MMDDIGPKAGKKIEHLDSKDKWQEVTITSTGGKAAGPNADYYNAKDDDSQALRMYLEKVQWQPLREEL